MSTKRSHILKQTCSRKLPVFLSICDFLQSNRHERVNAIHNIPINISYFLLYIEMRPNFDFLKVTFYFKQIFKPFKRQPHKVVIHTQTIHRQQPANWLSVFDHLVGLTLTVNERGGEYQKQDSLVTFRWRKPSLQLSNWIIFLKM